jgi:hypothetical protein
MNLTDDECIYKLWIHSHEEDDEAKKVYRSSSFDFPLSRGRDSFEIKKNGEIVSHAIGALDDIREKIGKFEIKYNNKLYVYFNKTKPTIMTILFCEKDRLVIQKN